MLHIVALLALSAGEEPAYARPDLLLEVGTLLKAKPGAFVVLDVRGRKAFDKGHFPGAQPVDASAWSEALNAGEKAEAWAERLSRLGIDGEKPVVVYGLPRTPDAARVWWMLGYWGLKDVRLVNGGWDALVKAGVKPETAWAKPAPAKPALEAQADRLTTKDDILKGLKAEDIGQLIDARTRDEHCGDARTAKRNGSIPGAKHLNWTDTLTEDGRFKTATQLASLFKDAGIDPKKPSVTYCQSGGRAAVMAFVVELMGGKPVRNYYRSWSEWGNDPKTPVVVK